MSHFTGSGTWKIYIFKKNQKLNFSPIRKKKELIFPSSGSNISHVPLTLPRLNFKYLNMSLIGVNLKSSYSFDLI